MTYFSYGQKSKILKTVKVFDRKKTIIIKNFDQNGNCIFSKVDGLYGPVVMISAKDYDSLNREIRSISAHCNIGFTMEENSYFKNNAKTFTYYPSNIDTIRQFKKYSYHPFDFIEKINSREQLNEIAEVKNLFSGKRVLVNITFLNENNKNFLRINFNKNGDTLTIENFLLNNWEVIKYFNKEEEDNKTIVTREYDNNFNIVKECRIQSNGLTEDYYFKFSATNKKIESVRFSNKTFEDKTVYIYDSMDRLIRKIEYYHTPDKITLITYYKNDQYGNMTKETCFDLTGHKKKLKYVYKTENVYWK